MEDLQIIQLYWDRQEEAILQSQQKYGGYCHTIAYNILHDLRDSEECVNDTWLRSWNAIPPTRPTCLRAFFGKITRNLALSLYERYTAKKRGGHATEVAIEELEGCLPAGNDVSQIADTMALTQILNTFLDGLSEDARLIFVRRYWYLSSVKDIAGRFGFTESKVKTTLMRTRTQLKECLEKEGIYV